MAGQRLCNTVSTSWMAAPVGDVMTPRVRTSAGNARLRSGANRPSAWSLSRSRSNAACSAPAPACSRCSTISWNSPRPSYSDTRQRSRMAMPLAGVTRICWLRLRNMAQRTWAPLSFREKYQ